MNAYYVARTYTRYLKCILSFNKINIIIAILQIEKLRLGEVN